MTELDPRIIMQAGRFEAPDFAQTLGQVSNLRAQAGQQRAQEMQLAQLTRQNAAADAKQAALQGAVGADGQIDYGKVRGAMIGAGDVEGAMSIDTNQANQQKAQLELRQKQTDRGIALIGGVFDQASLDQVRAQAEAEGLPSANIPTVFEPNQMRKIFLHGLSVKDQLAAEAAEAAAAYTKDKDDRNFQYRAGNDSANRGVTVRGQNMADARARETARPAPLNGGGKTLPVGEIDKFATSANTVQSIRDLRGSFKNGFSGLGTSLGNVIGRFGVGSAAQGEQADWWQSMDAFDNVVRNQLFGASLTTGEQQAWERTTVTPGMDPARIRANLKARDALLDRALSRKAQAYEAGGYNAGGVTRALAPTAAAPDPAPGKAQAAIGGGTLRPGAGGVFVWKPGK